MTAETPDLLIEFLETREADDDRLATGAGVVAWMAARGLVSPEMEASEGELTRVRHVRAALRALFSAQPGGDLDERTTATLERVTAETPLQVRFSPGEIRLEPATEGVTGGLARLVALVYKAQLDGTLARYKTCKKCGWAFYDESKNRSRVWCDMAVCGSQAKAQSYRARKKAE